MRRFDDILDDSERDYRARPTAIKVVFSAVIATAAIVALFFLGEYVQRYEYYNEVRRDYVDPIPVSPVRTAIDIVLNTIPELPLDWMQNELVDSGLPVYDLRISEDNLKYLQDTAERVTALGEAADIPREYVSADFLVEGEWVPVKVKLRGQTASHYHSRAPSLRLNFPKEQLFDGKEQLNISFIYDKGLTSDLMIAEELARYGILIWDSQFVVLRVNGTVAGLFQEIEQFGRSISDRQLRAEGFIFAGHGQLFGDPGLGFDQAQDALQLLVPCQALEGEKVPEHCDWAFFDEYFDIEKWAWAAAATTLLGSTHAWSAENLRMFWDPARGTFEPIPWDYLYFRIDPAVYPEGEAPPWDYRASLFELEEFRQLRNQKLWTLITSRLDHMVSRANELFDALSPALSYDLRHIGIETDILSHNEYIDIMRSNADLLRRLFEKRDLVVNIWPSANGQVNLKFENRGKAHVRVRSVRVREAGVDNVKDLKLPITIDGHWLGTPGTSVVSVPVANGTQIVGLDVINAVTGHEFTQSDLTFIRRSDDPPAISTDDASAKTDALSVDIDGISVNADEVAFGPGRVRLGETIIIPREYKVIFNPGTNLLLDDGVSLVIYGDFHSVGLPDSWIEISGATSRQWGGIFVHGRRMSPSSVNVAYTRVTGGSGGETIRSVFTSPFSVHDGDVTIAKSEFLQSATEDGINLKYATVSVADSLFAYSTSDAVDCDFCSGELRRNRILESGGDGLDFSGSVVELHDNRIDNCVDKGVSIGEGTTAQVFGTNVSNCYIGLAVKDSSLANISGGQLDNVQIGLAMYVKKPTFGPAQAKIRNVTMKDVESRYLYDGIGELTIESPGPADRDFVLSERSQDSRIVE